MLTPTLPSRIVPDYTVSNIWTALTIEPALTREWLVEGCKTYLREHRSDFDESQPLRKNLLLATLRHEHTNYDALADVIRRLTPGQGRLGRHIRKTLRQRIAAEYAHLLTPVEQQGGAQ